MNLAPLTGIAFAINWLIGKLNLNGWVVKTTRMTTNLANAEETALAVISEKSRLHRMAYRLNAQ